MTTTARAKLDSGLIDHDFVSQLIDAVGVDEYCMLIGSLTQEVEAQVANLELLAAQHQVEGIRQSAHRLSGLLSQFGAFEVSSVAERIWESSNIDEIDRLAMRMSKLCRASMAAITDLATD